MADSKEAYRFRREIEELAKKKGRGTELVSVYVPFGYELSKVTNKLAEEQGTATNIKSASTRKNVVSALEKIIQHLRLFDRTPENGIAVFCGNVSEQEGKVDIHLWSIIPPEKNNLNLYRCEKQFILEPLLDMATTKTVYGLIVIDRREGNIGFLRGMRIDCVKSLHSMVPGKFRAGGQSAARFERVIDGLANDFYKKVGESATNILNGEPNLKGIIVGGPGPTKYTFVDGGFIPKNLTAKILGILDIGYTGEDGLEELVNRAQDILKEAEVTKEKELVRKFLDGLARAGAVTYGRAQVKEALEKGAAETLLISEKIDSKIADELVQLAEKTGAITEFISTDTKEGEQMYSMGGIAALLRYKIYE